MSSRAKSKGYWNVASDRNLKENFKEIDPKGVLEKVAQIPVTEWNYKGYEQKHIGPMAQDFHAAFRLNDMDTMLNGADLHGVTLAAIQRVNQKLEEENEQLRQRMSELEAKLELLMKRLERERTAKPQNSCDP